MRKAVSLLAAVLLTASFSLAWAKEGSKAGPGDKTSGPAIQKYEEVERGLWLRANMGASMAINDMFGGDGTSSTWPPGPTLGLEMGYDLGQVASIHLSLHGQQVVGSRALSDDTVVSSDAALLAVMLGGRFNIFTTKRLGMFIKAQVGWMFTSPRAVDFDSGLLVGGGLGLDYATMLRHFFIGLEAGGSYDIANGGILVSLTPTLKYTF